MANEMGLFTSGVAIPAHILKKELSETTKALIGTSDARRIAIRGNIFRLYVGGQEVAKNDERAMNVVIAASAPKTSRQYFGGVYQEGSTSAPDCWSSDGEHPSPTIESPKHSNCAQCPMNISGSGQGTSKGCRYMHRLAVLLENDISGDIYELALPATSIFGKGENGKMPLFQYVRQVASYGVDITSVVTELRFDTDSTTPKMVFRAIRALSESEMETVLDKGTSVEALQAITTNFGSNRKDTAPAPVVNKKPALAAPVAVDEDEDEPVVREKKPVAKVADPTDLASTLAEWAD